MRRPSSLSRFRGPTRRDVLAGAGAGALALSAMPAVANVPSDPDIVVIGAGAAGLGATRTLMDMGVSVACVEARNLIGGRAYTDHDMFGVPYDTGCHWLHVEHLNPFADFARANGYTVYPAPYDGSLYVGEREATDAEYDAMDDTYNEIINAISEAGIEHRDVSPASVVRSTGPWVPLVAAWTGPWSMGKDMDAFSCADWWSFEDGEDWFCAEGFGTLVARYGTGLPVELDTPATLVRWGGDGVEVETAAGTIRARAAIVTVSTGILAADELRFDPPLSVEKQESFRRISMGTYNHIAMMFTEDVFGAGSDAYVDRQIESLDATGFLTNIAGTDLVFGYTGGTEGRMLERAGVEAAVDFGLSEVRDILGSAVDKKFVKGTFTRWGEDPWTMGSYASADPGYTSMRRVLRETVAEKVFFAGEACSGNLWATCAGALNSGIYAAQNARWAV